MKIFLREPDEYVRTIDRFAASIGLGDRVDVSGLGKILFQRYVETSDVVSASLISCNLHKLASVRIWYFTPSIRYLVQVHENAMKSFCAELHDAGWKGQANRLAIYPSPVSISGNVGSRRCAEFEFIKGKVSLLKSIVEEPCSARTPEQRLEAFKIRHNALTLLVVWAIDLSVGMRGIEHPYFHASEYDEISFMGCLADKDSGKGKKIRPFCLNGTAVEISKTHDAYLYQLSLIKKFCLPPSTRALPCYFVEIAGDRLITVPVSPKTIKDNFGEVFQFDSNWGRRFIKTMAIEAGLPAIYTDEYCGHSHRGEERWHTFGSFDPAPYFEQMSRFIEAQLKALGFKPLSLDLSILKNLEPAR